MTSSCMRFVYKTLPPVNSELHSPEAVVCIDGWFDSQTCIINILYVCSIAPTLSLLLVTHYVVITVRFKNFGTIASSGYHGKNVTLW